jgi:crossover junction endodeoxyribonuclease RuvC
VLLPGCAAMKLAADAADALAVAICHAHTAGTAARLRVGA